MLLLWSMAIWPISGMTAASRSGAFLRFTVLKAKLGAMRPLVTTEHIRRRDLWLGMNIRQILWSIPNSLLDVQYNNSCCSLWHGGFSFSSLPLAHGAKISISTKKATLKYARTGLSLTLPFQCCWIFIKIKPCDLSWITEITVQLILSQTTIFSLIQAKFCK